MSERNEKSFVDGAGARGVAGIVLIASIAGILAVAWDDLFPPAPLEPDVASNPELAACLEQRVGAVDKMRADGVIGAEQYDQFRARAESFCEGQFGS